MTKYLCKKQYFEGKHIICEVGKYYKGVDITKNIIRIVWPEQTITQNSYLYKKDPHFCKKKDKCTQHIRYLYEYFYTLEELRDIKLNMICG